MSRTKKRIKRLLKKALPLAALDGGAMLLGRRKGTAFPRPKAGTIDQMAADNMPKNIDKVIEDVPIPNLSRMTGAGSEGGVIGQNKRANFAKRMRNLDMDTRRNNMLRAIRSNVDIAPTPDSILDGMDPLMISAKDGGKIVKGEKKAVRPKKKTRIQIRGFGKARR